MIIFEYKIYFQVLTVSWAFPTKFSSKNRRNDDQKLEQHHFLFFATERLSAPEFEFRKFRKRVFVYDKQDISSDVAMYSFLTITVIIVQGHKRNW